MSQLIERKLPDPGEELVVKDAAGTYIQVRQLLFKDSHILRNNPIIKDRGLKERYTIKDNGKYGWQEKFGGFVIENPSDGPTGNPYVAFQVYQPEELILEEPQTQTRAELKGGSPASAGIDLGSVQ